MNKNQAAVILGRLGGKAGTGQAKARTTEQARAAAMARWGKKKSPKGLLHENSSIKPGASRAC